MARGATGRFFVAANGWASNRKSRPGGHRTALSAIAGSRPVPLPDFGEAARWLRPLIVRVFCPARLTTILIHKILTTSETKN
jgi:hypothetical protein